MYGMTACRYLIQLQIIFWISCSVAFGIALFAMGIIPLNVYVTYTWEQNYTFCSALRAASVCANWLMQPSTKYPIIKKINQVQSLSNVLYRWKCALALLMLPIITLTNMSPINWVRCILFEKSNVLFASRRLDFVRLTGHRCPNGLRSAFADDPGGETRMRVLMSNVHLMWKRGLLTSWPSWEKVRGILSWKSWRKQQPVHARGKAECGCSLYTRSCERWCCASVYLSAISCICPFNYSTNQ